jgi:outer membrane protein assembly factor BamD
MNPGLRNFPARGGNAAAPRRFPSFARLAAVLGVVLLAACAGTEEDEYVERPVESLYNEAMDALEVKDYRAAGALFDEVERQHPYSSWATKAQLMAAYAYYQNNDYDDAIVALDRFIQLHPSNRDVPYAYYLKGLSYYEQISDVARDQEMTELALSTLDELLKRFPNSKYARDAKLKIDLTRDHLAGKEMEIGRYYHNQGHYLAAINRFSNVVDNYQTTTHVPEALHRLTEAYLALGVKEEARKTAAVLGHNFPGSEWYLDSYEMMEGKKIRPEKEKKPWYKLW